VKGGSVKAKDARLLRACRIGDLEGAQVAISAGADVNLRFGKSGSSPLFTTVDGNEAQIVELLISAGADVNARATNGLPLLQLACIHGETGGVLLLIKSGVDPNARRPEHSKEAPLHLVHQPAVVRALVEAGANDNGDPPKWVLPPPRKGMKLTKPEHNGAS
jgi:ankyrin repeat protein